MTNSFDSPLNLHAHLNALAITDTPGNSTRYQIVNMAITLVSENPDLLDGKPVDAALRDLLQQVALQFTPKEGQA